MFIPLRTFWIAVVVFAALIATGGGWFYVSVPVVKTADGIMLLTEKQGKECAEGGGCAIFSEREFETAVNGILLRYCPRT